jgi:hypothetical protein
MRYYNKKESSVFVILVLAIASMMWIGIESPKHQQAVAQSPMDMMNKIMGGTNMTDGTMMMGNGNMSMPFNMGCCGYANDVHHPRPVAWITDRYVWR